jgi:hypothetical protein
MRKFARNVTTCDIPIRGWAAPRRPDKSKTDPAEFAKAATGTLDGFAPRYIALMELLQPFRRKHPQLPPLLSIIRDLSNADKHRLLQVAGAGVVNFSAHIVGDKGKGDKIASINPEPIKHNDVICVVESAKARSTPHNTVVYGEH